MKSLLLALTIGLLFVLGFAVLRPTQHRFAEPPLFAPESESIEFSLPMVVLGNERVASPVPTQLCGHGEADVAIDLELAPALGQASEASRGLSLRGPLPTDPPPAPDESLVGRLESSSGDEAAPATPLPRRLPSIEPAQMLPLGLPTAHVSDSSERQFLIHAAGAIEAEIPAGWQVFEKSIDRRVFAVLLPPAAAPPTEYRRDGIWFSHIAIPPRRTWAEENLAQELLRRLALLQGRAVVLETQPPATLGPWEAHSVVYQLTEPDPALSAPAAIEEILGGFMLVRTAWGLVEINAVAPRSVYESRQSAYEAIIRSLKLEAPSVPTVTSPQAASAPALLGSWKSTQSRLRLHGNARIELLFDDQLTIAIQPPAEGAGRPTVRRVAGVFEVRDDLLFVTWNDDSRSNFRWKLEEAELLLTDHEGRISRLARIYE